MCSVDALLAYNRRACKRYPTMVLAAGQLPKLPHAVTHMARTTAKQTRACKDNAEVREVHCHNLHMHGVLDEDKTPRGSWWRIYSRQELALAVKSTMQRPPVGQQKQSKLALIAKYIASLTSGVPAVGSSPHCNGPHACSFDACMLQNGRTHARLDTHSGSPAQSEHHW